MTSCLYFGCRSVHRKSTYPKLVNVTCLIHGINRVCETIRFEFDNFNKLISSVKKIFLKAPQPLPVFKEIFPNLQYPPEPIITRWGTWLEAAFYYADNQNLSTIRSIVDILDENASAIRKAKQLLAKDSIKCNLTTIKHKFYFLYCLLLKGCRNRAWYSRMHTSCCCNSSL